MDDTEITEAFEQIERPIDVPLGTTAGSIGRALLLATLTGIVDAGVFLKTGVLPSVMTANTIFIGMWGVMGRWESLMFAAVAVLTFLLASMIASRVVRDCVECVAQVQRRLAWFEFVALLVLAGVGLIGVFGPDLMPSDGYKLAARGVRDRGDGVSDAAGAQDRRHRHLDAVHHRRDRRSSVRPGRRRKRTQDPPTRAPLPDAHW